MIFALQENYCDALGQVYNETSLREVDINNLLEISIASDIVGGGELKFLSFSNCFQLFFISIRRIDLAYFNVCDLHKLCLEIRHT